MPKSQEKPKNINGAQSELEGVSETAKESVLVRVEHAASQAARAATENKLEKTARQAVKQARQNHIRNAHRQNANASPKISVSKATLRQITKQARLEHTQQVNPTSQIKNAGKLANAAVKSVGLIADYVEAREQGHSPADSAFSAGISAVAGAAAETIGGVVGGPILMGIFTPTAIATDAQERAHMQEAIDSQNATKEKPKAAAAPKAKAKKTLPAQQKNVNRAPSSSVPAVESQVPDTAAPANNNGDDGNDAQVEGCDALSVFGISADEARRFAEAAVERGVSPEECMADFQAVADWMADQEGAEQNIFSEENVNHYLQYAGLISDLGRALKCPALAQAGKAVEHAIVIGKGIATLLAATSAGAAVGGVGAIAGAVVGLVMMFMDSGPNPTEIILEKLAKLSDQLNELQRSMNEQFREMFKTQVFIMEMIDKGFRQLTKDLQQGIEAVRADLGERLADLNIALNYLVELHHLHADEAAQLGLRRECAAVESWLQGVSDGAPSRRIPELAQALSASATTAVCATAGSLTGTTRWTAWKHAGYDPSLFNQSVYADYSVLNDMIGFLAAYANQVRLQNASLAEQHLYQETEVLVNPYIWYVASTHYMRLLMAYADHDTDRYFVHLNRMLTAGEKVKEFIEDIAQDEDFWQYLIEDYYSSIKDVKKCLLEYAEQYSLSFQQNCNAEHPTLAIDHKTHPLDLLQGSPDNWHALFVEGKTIDKLQHNENIPTINNSGHRSNPVAFDPKLKAMASLQNKNRVIAALNARAVLPQVFLSAEYFHLLTYKVTQQTPIEGIAWINPVPHTKKWVNGVFKYHCKGDNPALPDPDLGPNSINPNNNWTLPLCVSAYDKNSGAEKTSIVLRYSAEWVVPTKAGFSTFAGKEHGEEIIVNGCTCCQHAWSSGDAEMAYGNYLVDCVQNHWENTEQKIAVSVTRTPSEAEQASMKADINALFFNHRRRMSLDLSSKNSTILAHATLHGNFYKALAKLDMTVNLIKSYAYLICKDPKLLQADLLSSTQITAELLSFANNGALDLNRLLSPALWQAFDRAQASAAVPSRLSAATIRALPDIPLKSLTTSPSKSLPAHPLLLVEAGLIELHRFEFLKQLRQTELPESVQCDSVEAYELRATILTEQMFRDETYEFFKEINAEAFNACKFSALRYQQYFTKLHSDDYSKNYLEVMRWAIQKSKSAVVVGNALVAPDEFEEKNEDLITNVKSRQNIIYALTSRGWVYNLGFLMRLATNLGGCQFDKILEPANFDMWGDGFLCLLKLIYNVKSADAAKATGNGPREQRVSVQECLSVGEQIKKIIFTICTSSTLFESLFDKYLQSLRKIKEKASIALEKNYANSEVAAWDFVARSEKWYFKRLTLYSTLLKSLLTLLLGYELSPEEIQNNRQLKLAINNLMGQDQIVDYLQKHRLADNNSGYSAFATMEACYSSLMALKVDVLNKIQIVNQQLASTDPTVQAAVKLGPPALQYLLEIGYKAERALEQSALVEEIDAHREQVKQNLAGDAKNELAKRKQAVQHAIEELEKRRQAALDAKSTPAARNSTSSSASVISMADDKEEKYPFNDSISSPGSIFNFDKLKTPGLSLQTVPRDGNCLFYSIAYSMEGTTRYSYHKRAEKLRAQVSRYMRENSADFAEYFADENELQLYIDDIKINRTWGDMIEIVIIANHILKRPVVIVSSNAQRPPIIINAESPATPVFLLYEYGLHYDALLPKRGVDVRKLMIEYQNRVQQPAAIDENLAQKKSSWYHLKKSIAATTQALTPEQEAMDIQRAILLSLLTAPANTKHKKSISTTFISSAHSNGFFGSQDSRSLSLSASKISVPGLLPSMSRP